MLVAPFDGTVAKIVGEVGEYSTPSPPGVPTPPAIDLIDESCLYVKAPMDEVDAPKIREGQVVRITLDALPGQVLPRQGAAHRALRRRRSRSRRARWTSRRPSTIPPKAGRLLVGYSADVEVVLDTRDNVLRVPTAALLEGGRVAGGRRRRPARRAQAEDGPRRTGSTPRWSTDWPPATGSSRRSSAPA